MKELENRINSVELCELINQLRKEEKGENAKVLLHKSLMEKIRKELETMEKLGITNGQNILLVEYTDKKGETRPCFSLNASGMRQILNSESVYVRCKTEEYITKLETKNRQLQQGAQITEKHLKDMEKRLENKTRMEMEALVGGYQRALVGMQNQMIDFQKQQQDLMMDFMEKVVNKLTNKPTVVNVKKEKYMTISDIIKGSKYKSATAANNILEKHSIVYREYYTEDGKEKFRTLATDSAIVLGLAINDPQNGYTRVLYTPKGISTVREILGLDDEQQISFDDPKIVNINR